MNQNKIRISIADDNKDFCDILKNFLIYIKIIIFYQLFPAAKSCKKCTLYVGICINIR